MDECNEPRLVDFDTIKQIRRDLITNQSEFEDKNFPLDTDRKIKWKRLKNFEEKAELFEDGVAVQGRIVPGTLGNPHFAIALSSVANHPKLLKYIFPDGQEINNPDSGSFFYFRFWKMGQWVYVYIDDKLPFIEEKKSGKSKSAKKDAKKKQSDVVETDSSTATSEASESRESKSWHSLESTTKKDCKKDESRKSCVKSIGKSEEVEHTIPENDTAPAEGIDLKDPACAALEKSKSCHASNTSQKVELEGHIPSEKSIKNLTENKHRQMSFAYVAGENEDIFYWASLLEKGYAKFCGGYRRLRDKSLDEILLDITGGMVEDLQASTNCKISFLDLKCHSDQHSLIIAMSKNLFHVDTKNQEEAHAGDNIEAGGERTLEVDYCIVTKIQFVDFRQINGLNKMIGFVRLLDPIGSLKWEDTWIEATEEWKLIPEPARQELKMEIRNAFECYLSYSNFLIAFPKIKVCSVPDGGRLNCEAYSGQWTIPRQIKEINELDKLNLHKSPQHRICVRDPNESDEPGLVVEILTSLILHENCYSKVPSGFWLMVYDLDRPGGLLLDFDYFRFRKPVAVLNLASAARLKLPQGTYLAVLASTSIVSSPTTLKYLLRFAIPSKFHGNLFSPIDQSTFTPYADSVDVTNYFDSSETLEEKSSMSGEKTAKLRRRSEKVARKEKHKGKKKKMKR